MGTAHGCSHEDKKSSATACCLIFSLALGPMDQDIRRKPSPCPVNMPVVLYSPVVLQEEQEEPSATDVQDVPGNLVGKDLVG